jgi:hypothetical protein
VDDEIVSSLRQIDALEVALFGGAFISEPALRQLVSGGVPVTHFSLGIFWISSCRLTCAPARAPTRAR